MSKLFNEKLYWLGQQLWTLSVTTMVLLLAIVTTVLHVLILVVSHLWTLVLMHVWKRHLSQGGSKRKQMDEKFAYRIGLDENIKLPATGEEAMQRLLNCRGKDPYSILGLKCQSTDEDIKKYYKKQAILVHPDKNSQTGAEEAFKILHHAFDMIGEPAKRQLYDSQVQQSHQAVRDFADLLEKLNEKFKKEANMMNCDKCGGKHQRIPLSRPWYSARYCQSCKTNHAANEGDVWAESTVLGFLWHYYTCIDGVIYDITEWVSCQKKLFKHMKSNAHRVSYRIEPTTNKTKSFWTGESEVDDFIHDLLNMSRQSNGSGPPHFNNNNRYNSSSGGDGGGSGAGSFFTPPSSASYPPTSSSTTTTNATAGRNTKRRRRKKKN
ncbi:dnaJ homolog subfamily C member 14 [Octopus bimaculoides]|uniref:J domain-containing protein n=1 Tax=Octopus bimaculoides TaxID=37653 RepID=A0A0L8FJD7_OCTBM|nr:dnaJ homolog subfamily C member 14 [Octopus bimaculoides]|eukprot:XP_014789481.1 PREDICTED: dnaJ homolog subfamily C member 14-like [Octopus bimaculoides]